MKLAELFPAKIVEASAPAYVTMDLDVNYIDEDDRDEQITAKVFVTCKSHEDAESLMGALEAEDDPIEVEDDDLLNHILDNSDLDGQQGAHGPGTIDHKSIKVVDTKPDGNVFAATRKNLIGY
jgi:hypothetical protein